MQDWYVWRGDDLVDGPHTFENLKRMRDDGLLGAEKRVRAGMARGLDTACQRAFECGTSRSAGWDRASLRFREASMAPGMPRLPVEDDRFGPPAVAEAARSQARLDGALCRTAMMPATLPQTPLCRRRADQTIFEGSA